VFSVNIKDSLHERNLSCLWLHFVSHWKFWTLLEKLTSVWWELIADFRETLYKQHALGKCAVAFSQETVYGLDEQCSTAFRDTIFVFVTASRPAVSHTALFFGGYQDLYPKVKRSEHEAHHTSVCEAEV